MSGKYLILVFFFILSLNACSDQEHKSIPKENLSTLIEQERKNEERAKYGDSTTSEIIVISKPREVRKWKGYILKKQKERRLAEQEKLKNQSPAKRYKSGDKSVVPQIIEILHSARTKTKDSIYNDLQRDFDQSEDYRITEPELIEAIFKNITIPSDEAQVIQLAGYMDLEGYPELFEKHLLSGNINKIERLVFWLGQDGKSMETLHYLENLIFQKNTTIDKDHNLISGLEEFASNGDSTIRAKVVDICFNIYNKKLIPESYFEEMKFSYSTANPAENLIEILFEYGDERVIPIVKKQLKEGLGLKENIAIEALIRLEGKQVEHLVYKKLRTTERLVDGIEPAITYYQYTKDEAIVHAILLELEKRKDYSSHSVYPVVAALIRMDTENHFSRLEEIIKNKNLITVLKETHQIAVGSVEKLASDLYNWGIVDQPFSKAFFEKTKKEPLYNYPKEYIYNFLSVSGIFLWFDTEPGIIPVDYDNLILDFAKNSNGKFSDIQVWMDTVMDKEYNVSYKIYLLANEKVYIASPEDIGDWYDIQLVSKLLNTALADSNLEERFVSIETGDQSAQFIFGPPKQVHFFVEQYKL